jgi:hypothetical protein
MPYIKRTDREKLSLWQKPDEHGCVWLPDTAGELNFCFTQHINTYLRDKGLSYQHINDVVGALEGAKAEFQRRVVGPYEDLKIAINGDVYDQSLLSRTNERNPAVQLPGVLRGDDEAT